MNRFRVGCPILVRSAKLLAVRDYGRAASELVRILGPAGARDLLSLLEQPDDVRADAFRQFHERGRYEPLLDALTELEADPVMRGWLVEHVRLELHEL